MSRFTADLALLFAALIWGVAFLFQKSAMDAVGPLTFIAARCGLATVVLVPFALAETRRRRPRADAGFWHIGLLSGAAFFVAAWLQQAGIVTATVTNTGFLTALYVVITPLIAWASAGRRPSAIIWPAVALSAAGTWLLGGGTLSAFSGGDGLVALSAVFWAAHVVIVGQAARHARPIAFTTLQFAVVAALAAIGAAGLEAPSVAGLLAAGTSILYVGVLSSALTFTLLTFALQHTPPSEAAVIVSLETVFAAVAAYLVLGERLAPIAWIGALMIMAGTLVIQLGGARKPQGLARREKA
ncbi:MAG: DMT family transporter [Hyphomicrobiaceae bacterium]|nr:DMT family transporter [Hyphomicrobiaceae bacterium]